MTTIAFDGVYLAADSRVSDGMAIHPAKFSKIREIKTRHRHFFLSGAGELQDLEMFFRWVEAGRQTKNIMKLKGMDGLLIDLSNHKAYEYGKWLQPVEMEAPHALGSGSSFALGAMAFGATAMEAVSIASVFDMGTGGDVIYVDLFAENKSIQKYNPHADLIKMMKMATKRKK